MRRNNETSPIKINTFVPATACSVAGWAFRVMLIAFVGFSGHSKQVRDLKD